MLATYRRNQRGYKPGMPCGNQLIGGVLFCSTKEGREAWIKRLNCHPSRFNHFVCFADVQSPWALQFGFAEWANLEHPYIDR